MIQNENNDAPDDLNFDIAIVPVGYERRCRWIVENRKITAKVMFGFDFDARQEASYDDNIKYFQKNGWDILSIQSSEVFEKLSSAAQQISKTVDYVRIFVDISSMSRSMMADICIMLNKINKKTAIVLTSAYTPTVYSGEYPRAPIIRSGPLKTELAGWETHLDKPLGVIMGLGCEEDLALGALQLLEPNKSWLFTPKGFDPKYEDLLLKANSGISDIFDIINFEYDISDPMITRRRIEALINSVEHSFRLLLIPFGPKIFSWLCLLSVVQQKRDNIGVWSFSSEDKIIVLDREVSGSIVWHNATLSIASEKD